MSVVASRPGVVADLVLRHCPACGRDILLYHLLFCGNGHPFHLDARLLELDAELRGEIHLYANALHGDALIANAGDQYIVHAGRNTQDEEVSVDVGRRTKRCAFYRDVGADERLTVGFVFHRSRDLAGVLGHPCREAEQKRQEGRATSDRQTPSPPTIHSCSMLTRHADSGEFPLPLPVHRLCL